METKLQKGNKSNYEITLVANKEEQEKARKDIIKYFKKDMEVPGFRKGEAPDSMVLEKVNPQYLSIGIMEQLINSGIKKILEENKDTKFIGEPFEVNQKQEEDKLNIMFKLDIFPEIEIKDEKWKKEKINEIKTEINNDEIEDAVINLKKNYAQYEETNEINTDTVSKIQVSFLNKDWEEIEKRTIYVGNEEFEQDKFYKDTFDKKAKDDEIEVSYKKTLPEAIKAKKDEKNTSKIKFTIKDIKKVVYPNFDEESLKKLFWPESTIKNEEELRAYIKEEIKKQKEEAELMKWVEDFLNKAKDSITIDIPKTLIDQEFKNRMDSLEKRFGGKEQTEAYFKQLGEEKTKEFNNDIIKAATESLQKFFILQEVIKQLELDVDRDNTQDLNVERKLYDHFNNKPKVEKK